MIMEDTFIKAKNVFQENSWQTKSSTVRLVTTPDGRKLADVRNAKKTRVPNA